MSEGRGGKKGRIESEEDLRMNEREKRRRRRKEGRSL